MVWWQKVKKESTYNEKVFGKGKRKKVNFYYIVRPVLPRSKNALSFSKSTAGAPE